VNSFAYRVYYEFKGPNTRDPSAIRKSDEEAATALGRVSFELLAYLSDPRATVSSGPLLAGASPGIEVSVQTGLEKAAVDTAMARCVEGLDLCATTYQSE
jgi:hypothetical protein